MKATVYITETQYTIQFGIAPTASLYDCTNHSDMVWSKPYIIQLPKGYSVHESIFGLDYIYDNNGNHCELIVHTDRHNQPVSVSLITADATVNVKVNQIRVHEEKSR